ncbi:phosphatidylinositol-glycan biosynthesis class F [Olea europaea subsp. europaea]|uniref:Phosphatidylinositol-glycan biosynthesis class F n=1 Tax=Olea europaea subsp. europaea TaxID=158383 RepID=A0A8S0RAR0_OLEEU|nr:phosphatidylinositol-glycan biosynthesis class F [Olea europaea subsp. europaea]
MEKEKRQRNLNSSETKIDMVLFIPPAKVFVLHLICGLGLASAFWAAQNFYSINLVSNPAETLHLIWIVEASVVILLYSLFRHNPDKCSYFKAVGRALVGLPAGAIVNALGAIVLGAPIGLQHFRKTVHWSLLMSVLTVYWSCRLYDLLSCTWSCYRGLVWRLAYAS